MQGAHGCDEVDREAITTPHLPPPNHLSAPFPYLIDQRYVLLVKLTFNASLASWGKELRGRDDERWSASSSRGCQVFPAPHCDVEGLVRYAVIRKLSIWLIQ